MSAASHVDPVGPCDSQSPRGDLSQMGFPATSTGEDEAGSSQAFLTLDDQAYASYTLFRDAGDEEQSPQASSAAAVEHEEASSSTETSNANDGRNVSLSEGAARDPEVSARRVAHRNRSATSVMAFSRNNDPNSSPSPSRSSQPASASSSAATSPSRKMFSFSCGQVRSSAIVEVISRAASDASTQDVLNEIHSDVQRSLLEAILSQSVATAAAAAISGTDMSLPPTATGATSASAKSKKKKKAPPTSLPPELTLPMPLRCDFCQKFDSVCSNCMFKWKGIAASRKSVLVASFLSLPEDRRLPLYFSTTAYGNLAFLEAIIEPLGSKLSELQMHYVPPLCTPEQAAKFERGGKITLLHVAFGVNRPAAAKLLFDKGAVMCKAHETRVAPTDLLPQPISQEWLDMLESQSAYEEFTMVERARRLRAEGCFEEALLEYQAVIKNNPYSELARCGIAKTMFDMGDLTECIRACDSVLSDQKEIRWLEHIPESVVLLKSEAVKALHEKSHKDVSTALRKCGCVIIDCDAHRIRLRKLPFKIIKDHVLMFCECSDLWSLWQATRNPLIQKSTERIASKFRLDSVGPMLTHEFGYAEMYEAIRADMPKPTLLKPPLRFLGVQVIAMADFHTFLMRASVVGGNPKYESDSFFSFGKKSEDSKRPRHVAIKNFQVYRAGVGKAWEIGDGGEWEVDIAASDALLTAVQQRMTTK